MTRSFLGEVVKTGIGACKKEVRACFYLWCVLFRCVLFRCAFVQSVCMFVFLREGVFVFVCLCVCVSLSVCGCIHTRVCRCV